jgi:signal transduction histidine kinase
LGSNGRGDWNDEGVRLAISMLPPWWPSWWFRAFVAALVLLAGWTCLQLRLRQQAHEFNLRLEQRLEARTRIARELHDTLLQSFQGLVYQFQAVRHLFPLRPEEALETLDSAIGVADSAIAVGRDAIQNLRAGPAERRLEVVLNLTGRELRDAQDVSGRMTAFQVTIEGQPRMLSPLMQDEIYRISREC